MKKNKFICVVLAIILCMFLSMISIINVFAEDDVDIDVDDNAAENDGNVKDINDENGDGANIENGEPEPAEDENDTDIVTDKDNSDSNSNPEMFTTICLIVIMGEGLAILAIMILTNLPESKKEKAAKVQGEKEELNGKLDLFARGIAQLNSNVGDLRKRIDNINSSIENLEVRPSNNYPDNDKFNGFDDLTSAQFDQGPDDPVDWFNWWVRKSMAVNLRDDFAFADMKFQVNYSVEFYQKKDDINATYIIYFDRNNEVLVFPNPHMFYNSMALYDKSFDYQNYSNPFQVTKPAVLKNDNSGWYGADRGKIE